MTPEWRRVIRLRNRLWKNYTRLRSESSWLTTGCYFQSKVHDSVIKPQEFCKFFGPTFRSKHSHTNDINLIEDDNFLMDEQQIANIFNDFFVNVASNVHEPDNDPPSNGFSDHSSILHIKSFM